MQTTQLIRKLGRTDIKLFGRDRLPVSMIVFVLYIVSVLRWGLPWLNTYLANKAIMPSDLIPMPLSDFYPMIVGFMAFFTGSLIMGAVIGYILLDEKDQQTITAMKVTPISLKQYVNYRVGLTTAISFVIIIFMVLFINQALVPLWQLLLLSAGAALTAPIATLFFAVIADNKVEGFAYGKFIGVAGWIIMIGWFVPEPWQWLFGLFPPFLISKAYWMALEGRNLWWIVLIIGSILQYLTIRWMTNLFNKNSSG